jgi:uncharacterized protein (TIGR02246 family)
MRTIIIGLLLMGSAVASANAATVDAATDEQAVRSVLASFDDAFNRHDAEGVSALYTDDAEFINVAGMWWRGRVEIKQGTAWVLENIFKNTQIHTDSVAVRFPTPDTAIAVITSHTVGSFVLPDGTRITSTKNRLSYFMVKREGRWLIAGGQNTEIRPGVHDPSKQ